MFDLFNLSSAIFRCKFLMGKERSENFQAINNVDKNITEPVISIAKALRVPEDWTVNEYFSYPSGNRGFDKKVELKNVKTELSILYCEKLLPFATLEYVDLQFLTKDEAAYLISEIKSFLINMHKSKSNNIRDKFMQFCSKYKN